VPAEEPDPDLEAPLVETDLVAVPEQQPGAAVTPDREADVVPDDRAGDRSRDHPPDLELARRAGIERRPDQGRLARHGYADALGHHEQEDDEVAVRLEPAVDRVRAEEEAERHRYILI